MTRLHPPLWLMLCGGFLAGGATAFSRPLPTTDSYSWTPTSPQAAVGSRRALQGDGYAGASSEPCSPAGARLDDKSGSLDFFDGHADGDVCSWTITCPPSGGTPVLVFSEFDTERGYDFVDVFSGADASGGASTRLAHLSGAGLGAIDSPGPYSARTHTMTVRFTADGRHVVSVGGPDLSVVVWRVTGH